MAGEGELARELRVRLLRQFGQDSRAYREHKQRVAQAALRLWQEAVTGTVLPGMTYRFTSRRYREAIHIVNLFSTRILLEADIPLASWIEHGHGAIDLKEALLRGPAARMGKAGPFTIVPIGKLSDREMGIETESLPETSAPIGRGRQARAARAEQAGRQMRQVEAREAAAQTRRRFTQASIARYGPGRPRGPKSFRMPPWGSAHRQVPGLGGGQVYHPLRTQSEQSPFRTVSSLSDATAWMLPPRPPNPVTRAVYRELVRRAATGEIG